MSASACELRNMNQGSPDCDFKIGIFDHIITTVDTGVSISVSDQRQIFAYLRTKSEEADPLKRFYPVTAMIEQVEDTSTEATMGSLDRGYEEKMVEGRFKYRLKYPSRIFRDRNLQKLDGFTGGAFFINSDNMVLGARNVDGSMSPFDVTIYADGGGPSASGGDIKTFDLLIDLGAKSKFINQVTTVKLRDIDRVNTLKGFRDVELLVLSVETGTATVQLVTAGDNINLYDNYNAKFGIADNWRVDGVKPTAVTADSAQKAFKITVGTGTHEINIAPVDVLIAAGVKGFEGIPVTVTAV